MLPAEAQASVLVNLLPPKNATDTAGATSGWVAIPAAEGCLVVSQIVGAMTGTLAGTLETSPYANGANNVAMLPDDGANFADETTDNNTQKKVVNARKNLGYMKYIGTVTTGPVLLNILVQYRPKTTT